MKKINKILVFVGILLCFCFKSHSQNDIQVLNEQLVLWERSSEDFVNKNMEIIPKRFQKYFRNSFRSFQTNEENHLSYYESLILFVTDKLKIDFDKEVEYLIEQFRGEQKFYFVVTESKNFIELKRNGFKWEKVDNTNFSIENLDEKFNSFNDFETCKKDHMGFYYYLLTKFNDNSIQIKLVDNGCSYSFSNGNGSH